MKLLNQHIFIFFTQSDGLIQQIYYNSSIGGIGMYTIFDVVNILLARESMDHLKLQKVCYYVYGWSLAIFGRQFLEPTRFEAWVHGPVNPSIYHRYKKFGWLNLPTIDVDLSQYAPEFVNFVHDVHNMHLLDSGTDLEVKTHSEAPWLNARSGLNCDEPCNFPISDEDILAFFRDRLGNNPS